ncbi:uncharacterized protein LOC129899897 [Solanum dulcamara]|uniref:uncharacterized protein LOC129899897 n=1 Tax=Solanum dulcamara TaxID=45834 RepID=UPI0024850563|nr:uncharacterized protein LOC129899897 [Solanum dulcamara]
MICWKRPINTPYQRFNKDKSANLMVPRENVGARTFPICMKCGRTHKEECLVSSNTCFKCGKTGHHARDCRGSGVGRPQGQIAYGQQTQGGGQPTNYFYALHGRQEVEEAPNVVISILKVFAFDVYAPLDLGTNFSFVTTFLDNRFDVLPEMSCTTTMVHGTWYPPQTVKVSVEEV